MKKNKNELEKQKYENIETRNLPKKR